MESYQVVLEGDAAPERVRSALLALPGVGPDEGFLRDSEYLVLRDGKHVFEIEFSPTPLRLSLRFALTHPPTVDAAFLSLVLKLLTNTGLMVRVLEDDVPDEFVDGYDLAHFDQFARVVMTHIAMDRRIWITTFGPATRAGSTSEAWELVIRPQLEPLPARSKETG